MSALERDLHEPRSPEILTVGNDWKLVRSRDIDIDPKKPWLARLSSEQFLLTPAGIDEAKQHPGLLRDVGNDLRAAFPLLREARKPRLDALEKMNWLHVGAGSIHDVFRITHQDINLAVRIARNFSDLDSPHLPGNAAQAGILELMKEQYDYDVVKVYAATRDFLVMEYVNAPTAARFIEQHPDMAEAVTNDGIRAAKDYYRLLPGYHLPSGADIKAGQDSANFFVIEDDSPRGFHIKLFDVGHGQNSTTGMPYHKDEPIIHEKNRYKA